MNIRPRRREEPDLNVTPLIDVVFLLLIFFMVTTTFRKEGQFDLELPEASNAGQSIEQETITIDIDAAGFYTVDQRRLPDRRLPTLNAALGGVLKTLGDTGAANTIPLLIRADGKTPHQAVVKVLDAASQLGLSNVGIIAINDSVVE